MLVVVTYPYGSRLISTRRLPSVSHSATAHLRLSVVAVARQGLGRTVSPRVGTPHQIFPAPRCVATPTVRAGTSRPHSNWWLIGSG